MGNNGKSLVQGMMGCVCAWAHSNIEVSKAKLLQQKAGKLSNQKSWVLAILIFFSLRSIFSSSEQFKLRESVGSLCLMFFSSIITDKKWQLLFRITCCSRGRLLAVTSIIDSFHWLSYTVHVYLRKIKPTHHFILETI